MRPTSTEPSPLPRLPLFDSLPRAVGVELAVLSPLEGITEEDQKKGSDYISVMLDNLEALKKSIN